MWLMNPHRFGSGGGGAPIGAHQYWRIYAMAGDAPETAIVKISMAATAGGADQCVGGTVLHAQFGSSASGAFDNNDGTWADRSRYEDGDDAWLGYQFPAPVAVAEIRIKARTGAGAIRAPRVFIVEYSDDGVNWTFVDIPPFATAYGEGETKTFAITETTLPPLIREEARLWRYVVDAVNGGFFKKTTEFALRATSGGANLCAGKPFTQSAGFTPNLVDGTSSEWQWTQSPPQSAFFFFETPPNPSFVYIKGPSSFAATDGPKDFRVQYSNNARDWVTVLERTGESWVDKQEREYALP